MRGWAHRSPGTEALGFRALVWDLQSGANLPVDRFYDALQLAEGQAAQVLLSAAGVLDKPGAQLVGSRGLFQVDHVADVQCNFVSVIEHG